MINGFLFFLSILHTCSSLRIVLNVISIYFLFQHPVLNKRLGIVILEGILELLFQEQDFKTIFQKLHSRSTRVRNELRNSQRKYADIRR